MRAATQALQARRALAGAALAPRKIRGHTGAVGRGGARGPRVRCSAAEPKRKGPSAKSIGLAAGGECMMVLATTLASERIPLVLEMPLAATLLGAWAAVGYARGDFKRAGEVLEDGDDTWSIMTGAFIYEVVDQTMLTWLIWAPCALLAWAGLYSRLSLAPEFSSVHDVVAPMESRPAEVQVVAAVFITVLCWRLLFRFISGSSARN
ncbi:unnamed protein product [Pedinophyceae sp. YPF-701]|nr:unnamed protein product [Pedinophyceae sp. YPF-701]